MFPIGFTRKFCWWSSLGEVTGGGWIYSTLRTIICNSGVEVSYTCPENPREKQHSSYEHQLPVYSHEFSGT